VDSFPIGQTSLHFTIKFKIVDDQNGQHGKILYSSTDLSIARSATLSTQVHKSPVQFKQLCWTSWLS